MGSPFPKSSTPNSRMVDERHLRALVALDLRRAWPGLRTIGLLTCGTFGLVVFLGKGSITNMLVIVMGAGLGVATAGIPMTVMRDKLDGTLEFLCTLPTSANTIAGAKFITSALGTLPWAVGSGAVVWVMGVPEEFPASVPSAALGGSIVIWITYCLISWWLIALWARFEPEKTGWIPLVALLTLFIVADPLFELLGLSNPVAAMELLRSFLGQPWARAAILLAAGGAATAVSAMAFLLTVHAFATYRPKPAEL